MLLNQDFWRGAVYNDSEWTPHNFSVADMEFATGVNPGRVNGAEADLGRFYAKGGKIISYHGRSDQTVTSKLSMEYYSRVHEALDITVDDMHSFYRLFFIPGMRHCSGGLGASAMGQSYPLNVDKLNPRENLLLALVDWVENANGPPFVVGSKYAGDDVAQPAVAQRSKSFIATGTQRVIKHRPDLSTQNIASTRMKADGMALATRLLLGAGGAFYQVILFERMGLSR